ncbi:MAG: hypothetical protein VXV81_03010 [Candidatus Thermoplasmatota archaeon]|nr:hypothetical protein [Candidatus Thermoplasmatota archaeon]
MSEPISHSLEAFHSTISVMLVDKVLTREEKRLIIKLASALGLNEDEPSQIYQAVRTGQEVKGGEPIDNKKAHEIYTKVFEIAIVNASLSRDEFRVLAHLRDIFKIDDEEHHRIEEELREIVREKFEDPNVIDKMLGTLRDSVSLVGDLFDVVRKKAADGARK